MANKSNLALVTDNYRKRIAESLHSGGGGGNSGDMDARLSRLENGYEKLRDDIGEVRTGLAVLTERVSHLPSKGFIVTSSLTALALIGAAVLFQDRLTAFFGI